MSPGRRPNPRPIPLNETMIRAAAREVTLQIRSALERIEYERWDDKGWATRPFGATSRREMLLAIKFPNLAQSVKGGPARTTDLVVVSSVQQNLTYPKAPFASASAATTAAGVPFIKLSLNGHLTPAELLATSDAAGDGPMLKQASQILRHELTHLAEHTLRYERHDRDKPFDGHQVRQYYNEPVEVRAYMQEIVHEAQAWVTLFYETMVKHPSMGERRAREKLATTHDLTTHALKASPTWSKIQQYLFTAGRRKILLATFRAVEEARAALLAETSSMTRQQNPAHEDDVGDDGLLGETKYLFGGCEPRVIARRPTRSGRMEHLVALRHHIPPPRHSENPWKHHHLRYLLNDGTPVAGLILSSRGKLANIDMVYTDPAHRRAGYATQLLAFARERFTVRHSKTLTDHGKAWARAVNPVRAPRIMNLEQYAKMTNGKTSTDVQGHIHAGLRSAPTTKTYKRFFDRVYNELQAAAAKTRADYHAAIERGEISPPPRPSLEEIADRGGDDGEAAQRVLARRAARRREMGQS